ncbi:MAG TPA: N-acetylneuraminate synthase family protein [Leptospiraceae bacterium]|nr:N-acetylneuraminate synthase family protein [Leptospirales bacterium]HMU84562.1 N-acetylneuraminate synthase family protein [Leptospiraceae bacterium]HMW59591.1 N-acetylneuraminate synthase family protein [Leptospiraceae bacterium]HMX58128.1 N-acetylneuraminate synthase family protein [Leptospiraceae bacterium]HMZ36783.1 N-acetylneuraminate synthase family protein [Leptospiraceae bacterium]
MMETEHHRIGQGQKPYLIAEIGLNHNGDPALAKKLVDAARTSGAHAVKFQLYDSDHFIHEEARLGDGSLREFFRQFELSSAQWHDLAGYARSCGLDFFCSVFDFPSIELYASLSPRLIKIASCDLTNRPLIQECAHRLPGVPLMIATGTADEAEVESLMAWIRSLSSPVILLECVSHYPANPDEYNIGLIQQWNQKFDVPVGISDHTSGIGVSLAACLLGAVAVERHFTTSHDLPGPDQKISLTAETFALMRNEIDAALSTRRSGNKQVQKSESAPRKFGRRGVYAARDIKSGSTLSDQDLLFMRPGGDGVRPEENLAGRTLKKDKKTGDMILGEDL